MISKYIGIPYELGGASEWGSDCWGLVKFLYRLQHQIELPLYNGELSGRRAPPRGFVAERMREEGARAWITVPRTAAQRLDVAVLRYLRPSDHVAIVTEDPNWLLTTNRALGSHLIGWDEYPLEGVYRYVGV